MRLCVVDCSFSMAWVFADEKNATAEALLARGDELDRLVRACDLTSYDAVYLAIALEQGLPLATTDEQLATAARRVGVGRFGE